MMKLLVRTFEDRLYTLDCNDFTFRANKENNILKLKTDEGIVNIENVKVFTMVH